MNHCSESSSIHPSIRAPSSQTQTPRSLTKDSVFPWIDGRGEKVDQNLPLMTDNDTADTYGKPYRHGFRSRSGNSGGTGLMSHALRIVRRVPGSTDNSTANLANWQCPVLQSGPHLLVSSVSLDSMSNRARMSLKSDCLQLANPFAWISSIGLKFEIHHWRIRSRVSRSSPRIDLCCDCEM